MKQDDPRSGFMRFDSPEHYADYLNSVPTQYRHYGRFDWSGGMTFSQATDKLITGDETNLDKAENIISQMKDTEIFTSGLPQPINDVWGYVPDVPAAIANLPKTMIRRVVSEQTSQTTPVSIYVDIGVSDSIPHNHILNRGVACLALAMALQITRPVELYACLAYDVYHTRNTQAAIIKISNTPLDLARAVWMLTHPAMVRTLGFTYANSFAKFKDTSVVWWGFRSDPTRDVYVQKFRELIGTTDRDIFIKGGYISDALMLRNPVQWVKNMVKECNKSLEEIE